MIRDALPDPGTRGVAKEVARRRFAPTLLELVPVAVSALLTCWFSYPGLMSSDSHTIMEEARTWVFGSGHPPIMGIVWGLLNMVSSGTAPMLVLQVFLFAFAIWWLLRWLLSGVHPGVRGALAGLVLATPMVFSISGVIWKDIWCAALLALSAGSMLRAYRMGSMSAAGMMVVLGTLWFAILFRPNAAGAVVAIAAGIAYLQFGRLPVLAPEFRRRASALAAGLLCAGALFGAGQAFDRAVGASLPPYSVYFFDIAGVVMNSDRKAEFQRVIQTRYPEILRSPSEFPAMLEDSYMPYTMVSLNPNWGNDRAPFTLPLTERTAPQFREVRRYVISSDPGAYLRYRIEYTRYLLGMMVTPGAGRNGWVLGKLSVPRQAVAYRYVQSFEKTWAFSTVPWLAIALPYAIALLWPRTSQWGVGLAWLGLSAFGIVGVLFLVGPSPDYRYTFWPIIVGVLLLLHLATWSLSRLRLHKVRGPDHKRAGSLPLMNLDHERSQRRTCIS